MCKPIAHLFVAVTLVTVLFGGEAWAAEDSKQLRGSTVATQAAWTAAVTVVPVGLATGLYSYGFAMPTTNFSGGYFYMLLAATGVGIAAITSTVPTAMTNQVGHDQVDRFYLLGPFIGSIVGGIAGIYGGRAISDNLWRTPRLDWQQKRWRTGFTIGLPITLGLTIGGVAGYALEHSVRGNADAGSPAARHPTVAPVLGTPAGADDSGWTLGASLRF